MRPNPTMPLEATLTLLHIVRAWPRGSEFVMRKLILLLSVLVIGCVPPRTVTRSELEGMKAHRQELKVSMWYYTGTKHGYHYFHHDDLGDDPKDFRVAESELSWTNTFPKTHNRKK